MNKKLKLLMIGDHILSPSGVGTQCKYIIEGLLKTGKYQVIQLGGAVKHQDMRPMQFEGQPWPKEDLIIFPVEGYGTPDIVRSMLRAHKPDILVFFTDPRFYYWLWQIENEIRPLCPMVYYHVWDNFPYPKFNKVLYESTDFITTISKITSNIVKNVAPSVPEQYLPHAVDLNMFKRFSEHEPVQVGFDPKNNNAPIFSSLTKFRQENFSKDEGKMIFFWNNRNARRKQSGTLIWWFKEFLDRVGHDKARLILHTEPKDENGQDLVAIIKDLGEDGKGSISISQDKIMPQALSVLLNTVDCVINISDAEGFGLGTMEALACETPIIVNMTGGLQEQVTDLSDVLLTPELVEQRHLKKPGVSVYEHGIGIEPASHTVIGSQQVPYIWEDRLNKEDFISALTLMLNMSKDERRVMGRRGREHLEKHYSFDRYITKWDEILSGVHEKCGSWPTNYQSYEMRKI